MDSDFKDKTIKINIRIQNTNIFSFVDWWKKNQSPKSQKIKVS
jgi:putative IMPACT (imprinted ancient) family translation regulator